MSEEYLSEATKAALDAGLALFDARRFWDAHEAWEEAWLAEEGDVKLFLQGVIQLAAACHKGLVMKHPRGMASLFAHAAEKLEHLAQTHQVLGGLELARLITLARIGEGLAHAWHDGRRDGFDESAIPRLGPA